MNHLEELMWLALSPLRWLILSIGGSFTKWILLFENARNQILKRLQFVLNKKIFSIYNCVTSAFFLYFPFPVSVRVTNRVVSPVTSVILETAEA